MMRSALLLIALLAALAAGRPAAAAPGPPALDAGGFIVDGPFLAFAEAHGGLAALGRPLSDALYDEMEGALVQYFAYARLELRDAAVSLTRLGSLRAAGRDGEPPFRWLAPEAPRPAGSAYIAESGHSLGGAFAWYHAGHGGVTLLGWPISEEFVELQPDGAGLLVQYFERAVLSYHPGADGAPGEVRRAELGAWLAEARLAPAQRAPGRPLAVLARASLSYRAGSGDGANIELAARRLDGAVLEPGQALSFLGAVGEVSEAGGYVPGSGIVGGELRDDVVAGGICTVSTLLLRAGWAAGLPVEEWRAHRYLLRAYADLPGLDAAVFAPGQDLRVRNDTGARLYVSAAAVAGLATLTLWGRGDGREVALTPPQWAAGGRLEVVNARTVRPAGGAARRERLVTRYEPRPAPEREPEKPEEEPAGAPGREPEKPEEEPAGAPGRGPS